MDWDPKNPTADLSIMDMGYEAYKEELFRRECEYLRKNPSPLYSRVLFGIILWATVFCFLLASTFPWARWGLFCCLFFTFVFEPFFYKVSGISLLAGRDPALKKYATLF